MKKFEQFKLNLDIFGGYITEPKIHYYNSGKCKCEFAIPLKLKKEDEPVFLNCECWGRIAEKAGELKKGDEVLVYGFLKEVEYETIRTKEKKTKIVFMVKGVI